MSPASERAPESGQLGMNFETLSGTRGPASGIHVGRAVDRFYPELRLDEKRQAVSDAVGARLGRTEVPERFGRHTPRSPCLPTNAEGDDRANFRHDVGRSMSRRTDALDGRELGDSDDERAFALQ